MRRKKILVMMAAGLLFFGACDQKGEEGGAGAESETTASASVRGQEDTDPGIPGFRFGVESQQTAQSDLAEVVLDPTFEPQEVLEIRRTAPSSIEVPEEPYEGAHDPEIPVSAGEYRDKMVEAICLGFQECKNEELTMAAFSLFITQLAEMELDPETDSNLGNVVHFIAQEQRLPTRQDCELVFGAVMDTTHYDGESLEKYIQANAIGFNQEAAGQCVARFGSPFPLCMLEREISARPDMQMFMMNVMQHQGNLMEHFAPCMEVIEGQLPEGAACDEPFQCAGERMFCQPDYPGGPGRCVRAPMGMGGGGMFP